MSAVKGFTVSQVVHDYGDVCQSITELAMELGSPIELDDFRMLNCCLDNAIAGAVGLAYCRWGAETNNGRIHTRNVPGKGCVFTMDLPRVEARAMIPAG